MRYSCKKINTLFYSVTLTALLSTVLAGCATLQEENKSYANTCKKEQNDNDIIACYHRIIKQKIKAKWRTSTTGLTESDFPQMYKVKTKIFVNGYGQITDFKILTTSNSHKLDRSIVKGIKRSSPLPVPNEPLFTQGGFNIINYDFVHDDVPPVFGSKKVEEPDQ